MTLGTIPCRFLEDYKMFRTPWPALGFVCLLAWQAGWACAQPSAEYQEITLPSEPTLPAAILPSPEELDDAPLRPLAEELWLHGGSYLYQPEGDRLNWPAPGDSCYQYLRLPEDWQKPQPVTLFAEYLGADPINPWPEIHCRGCEDFQRGPDR